MYTKLAIFTLAYLAPTALGYAANEGYTPPPSLFKREFSCSGGSQHCANVCISSSADCCDDSNDSLYYCSNGYSCGHAGKCCLNGQDEDDNECTATGTYIGSNNDGATITATSGATATSTMSTQSTPSSTNETGSATATSTSSSSSTSTSTSSGGTATTTTSSATSTTATGAAAQFARSEYGATAALVAMAIACLG